MSQEDRIDRYFSGEMDDLERLDFDKEVMRNTNLAIAVEEYKNLVMGIRTYGLKQKLDVILNEESETKVDEEEKPEKKSFRRYYLLIGGLILFGLFLILRPKSNDQESTSAPALYIAYYYIDPGLPTKMGSQEDLNFDKGMVQYKQGDYERAIHTWSQQASDDSKTTYYIGAAYLAIGNHDFAAIQFIQLTKTDPLYDRAQWYLALISLKQENKGPSIQYLKSILKLEQSNYKDRAKELLDKVSN